MTHLRIDDNELNRDAKFECGLSGSLPAGDRYVFEAEIGLHRLVDCEGCGGAKVQLGTPISELSGRPGTPGYEKFKRIADSWGYD